MSTIQFPAESREVPWVPGTAVHRWYGFGRYYAMFPPSFAHDAVQAFTSPGEMILDPFCGRGNAPFTATVLGRRSLAIDVNPVAWLFSEVKMKPAKSPDRLLRRLKEIGRASRHSDRNGRCRFERMAWAPGVRAFLRAARRELDWENSVTDRTVMAFVALHMQDKHRSGLSNVLWPTIACSPRYAIAWWTKHGFSKPPDVNPVHVLSQKIMNRYRYGVPEQERGRVLLADAREALQNERCRLNATLLITSPPYSGVTDYWNDHWIRLWALGHYLRKDWRKSDKHENRETYRSLIFDVLSEARRHLSVDATILVRSDQRGHTATTCADAMRATWPDRHLHFRFSVSPHHGISVHHGRGGKKAREIDFLITKRQSEAWCGKQGFSIYTPDAVHLAGGRSG